MTKHKIFNMWFRIGIILLFFYTSNIKAQVIQVPISNDYVYSFFDEMAVEGYISINTSVKPYTVSDFNRMISELVEKRSLLNKRQQNDLDYFQLIFSESRDSLDVDHIFNDLFIKANPVKKESTPLHLLSFTQNNVQIRINPILGFQVWRNQDKTFYHRWNGAEGEISIGKNWGGYLRFWDNKESIELEKPEYLSLRQGANYRSNGQEYLRVKTGFTYTWSWGSAGLYYDDLQWGSGYNGSNILSGKSPSFAQLRLRIKPVDWFELNYMHGWLYSMIIDSARSYEFQKTLNYSRRDIFRPKYIAANYFTIKPWDFLYFSFGNSIIYSDYSVQPAYLIPMMFFRIADTDLESITNTAGNNSQIFFNLDVYPIKRLHLYSSLFVDEIAFSRMWDPAKHSNYISLKAGASYANLANSNATLIFEYTRTHPEVYRHILPTTDFESNNFTLGHYLKDNSQELYLAVRYYPFSKFKALLSYTNIKKGPDYQYLNAPSRWGLPFLDPVVFQMNTLALHVSYMIKNRVGVMVGYEYSKSEGDLSFLPVPYHGQQHTLNFGLFWGR